MVLARVTNLTLTIIFICSFSMGVFQFFGFPLFVPKITSEGLVIILFMAAALSCLFKRDSKFNLFGLAPVGGVLAAGLISGYAHDGGIMQLIIFVRETLKFYLLFLALINLHTPENIIERSLMLLLILFAIQIPVSWLKFYLVGIEEDWIGTVHMGAGQLSLLIPMVASSFLFASFLYTRRVIHLVWILLFFIFSIIGEKEAVSFIFHPLLIFLLWYYYSIEFSYEKLGFIHSIKKLFSVKNMAIIIVTWTMAIFLSTQLLPSLNPEEKRMGTYDMAYVFTYVSSYLLRDLEDQKWNNPDIENDMGVQMGRFQVISEAARQIVSGDAISFLFGYGGGSTSKSPWVGQGSDIMYKRFGIRGATPAMAQILLECGIVGLSCMLYLFYLFYRAIHLKLLATNNPAEKAMILGMLGMHVTFIFDFVMYSQASLFYGVLTPVYFFMLALLIKDQVIPFSFLN